MKVIPEMRRAHWIKYLRFPDRHVVYASAVQYSVYRHWHGLLDIFIIEIYTL